MSEEAPDNKDSEPSKEELDQRLKALNARIERRASGTKAPTQSNRTGWAYGVKLGSEFMSAIIVGAAIGYVADIWIGTSPFGFIIFLLLGFVAGVLNILRATGAVAQPLQNDKNDDALDK